MLFWCGDGRKVNGTMRKMYAVEGERRQSRGTVDKKDILEEGILICVEKMFLVTVVSVCNLIISSCLHNGCQ